MTTSKPPFKSNTPTPTLPLGTSRFLSAYGPKQKLSITFSGPGRTKQSFKDECDINNIMARFQQTGLLEFVNKNQAQYLDVTGFDYQEAMQTVANANSLFMQMPSALRAEFQNSPQKFVEFCENPENRPRMAEMGLLTPEAQNQGGSPTPASTTQSTPQSAPPAAPVAGSDAPGT